MIYLDTDVDPTTDAYEKGISTEPVWSQSKGAGGGTYGDTTRVAFYRGKMMGLAEARKMRRGYTLLENYPNPFNPSTIIPFTLPEGLHVCLTVHTVLGERVGIFADKRLAARRDKIELSARGLASGTYFVRMTAGFYADTRPVVLIE